MTRMFRWSRFARTTRAASMVTLLAMGAGCALTSKADSVVLRYFTPERMTARTATPPPPQGADSRNLQLRLGRVQAASYLRDKIAFRDSDYEVGYYEDWRWTEKPESYVRRAAGRALFEDQRIRQVISGPAPTLEVVVNAFEELRVPRHVARVEVTWSLRDDQSVLMQRTVMVEHAIENGKPEAQASAVANAMADALGEAVTTLVTGVVVELSRTPPPPQPPPS